MGENSAIAWTDHTFNPYWGCSKASSECEHCYAEKFAKRTGHDCFGPGKPRRFFGESHWREPLKWNAAAAESGVRARVFCGSMCDIFECNDSLDVHRARVMSLIAATPALDWLLLSKRPANAAFMLPPTFREDSPRNLWLGTTIGCRASLPRLDDLRRLPAILRFLSCEPLLEDLGPIDLTGIGWVIVGGESGPNCRPMEDDWARDIRDQCAAAGVPFFFKQRHGFKPAHCPPLDGIVHRAIPSVRP